jgi:hypothetical protein
MQDQPSSALAKAIRSLIKTLLHFFSRQTEIERASRSLNIFALCSYVTPQSLPLLSPRF